jgi:acetoin utilization deacetylase AcuC-like enzyme
MKLGSGRLLIVSSMVLGVVGLQRHISVSALYSAGRWRTRTLRRQSLSSSASGLIDSFAPHPDVRDSYLPYDPSKPYFPIYYNDVYEVILPAGHRFPMEKYHRVRQLVQKAIDSDINTSERTLVQTQFLVSPFASWDDLVTTHAPDYVERFLRGDLTAVELRNVGFPWSHAGVKRALSSTGGTIAAACAVCEAQLQHSNPYPIWAAHLAGGTHHAFYDRGEGFCVFSDIAVAANVVRRKYPDVKRILILDLDVHQGNGNAVLFQGRPDVVTFSMQCHANYFSKKEESDLDVELPVGCNDETYIATLRHWLKQIERKGGTFDLVFFQAGVDVLEHDRLGRMDLTAEGVKQRNELVFDFCASKNLPLVITMGGGYPRNNDWSPILEAHAGVYLEAHQYLMKRATQG